jgi:hypothetical protein
MQPVRRFVCTLKNSTELSMQSEITTVAPLAKNPQVPATTQGPTPIAASLLHFIGGGKAPAMNLLPVNKWS